jgi:NAD(P)-dependent dehydrogenase (short-subunit alcohol dehydrogenase family)
MDRFIDTPLELLDHHLEANVMAPLALIKEFLPGMLDRGSGIIINISSGAGTHDPSAPAGNGGWGIGYGFSKGALHRIAGILWLELGERGIRPYNVQPRYIATERMAQDMAGFGFDFDTSSGPPPDAVGAAVSWIVRNPGAADARLATDAREVEAQQLGGRSQVRLDECRSGPGHDLEADTVVNDQRGEWRSVLVHLGISGRRRLSGSVIGVRLKVL